MPRKKADRPGVSASATAGPVQGLATGASFRTSAAFGGGAAKDQPIPKEWKQRAKLAWDFYCEEPLVKNAINSWRAFALGDTVTIGSDDDDALNEAKDFAENAGLSEFVSDMILQLLTKGDAVGYILPTKDAKDIEELVCVNPVTCEPKYLNGRLESLVQKEELKNGLEGSPVELQLSQVLHLRWDSPPFSPHGNSMILAAFESIDLLKHYRKAERAIAKRWQTPLRLIKVGGHYGTKVINPTQQDLDRVRSLVNNLDLNSGLVVPFYVSVETSGTEGQVLDVEKKVEGVKEDILVAMGTSRALIAGDGPNFATAQVSLQKMAVQIQDITKVAKRICKWIFNYRDTIKATKSSLTFHFKSLDPTDEGDRQKILIELYDRKLISRQTIQTKMELDPTTETSNIEQEGVDIFNDKSTKSIIDLAVAGVLTPAEARKYLGLEAESASQPAPSETMASFAGRLCDECSECGENKTCNTLNLERPQGSRACRFFQGK